MTNIAIQPNINHTPDKGTQVELDRGVFIRLGEFGGTNYASISVAEARSVADRLITLADEIEQRFAKAEAKRQAPLGLGKGSIIRLRTGATLVLDEPTDHRPFRVVANGGFVPGSSSVPRTTRAPRWSVKSIQEIGYEVLVQV